MESTPFRSVRSRVGCGIALAGLVAAVAVAALLAPGRAQASPLTGAAMVCHQLGTLTTSGAYPEIFACTFPSSIQAGDVLSERPFAGLLQLCGAAGGTGIAVRSTDNSLVCLAGPV